MKKKILVISDSVQATQLISFLLPSRSEEDANIKFQLLDYNASKKDIASVTSRKYLSKLKMDAIILSRFTLKFGFISVEYARKVGIPVAFHIDDYLLDVPPEIGLDKYSKYMGTEYQNSMLELMSLVDYVIASTPNLAHMLMDKGIKNVRVTPCYRCSIGSSISVTANTSSVPKIGYMGTKTHSHDLQMLVPSIISAMIRFDNLQFETFGLSVPNEIKSLFPSRVCSLNISSNYSDFLDRLSSAGWWLGLAPLYRSVFNNCKAPTKWIEYTEAGIPCIAENFGPYRGLDHNYSILLSNCQDDWYEMICHLIVSRYKRELLVKSAKKIQQSEFTASSILDFYNHLFFE